MSAFWVYIALILMLHGTTAAAPQDECVSSTESAGHHFNITARNAHCTFSLPTNLHALRVDSVAGFNFSVLRELTSLTQLACTRCGLRDFNALKFISSSIEHIDLTENGIRNTSVTQLDRLFNLRTLILDANSIRFADLRCIHASTVYLRWNPLRTVMFCTPHTPRITLINDTSPHIIFDSSSECCEEMATMPRVYAEVAPELETAQAVEVSSTSSQSPLHIALEVVGGLLGMIVTSVIAHFMRLWCRRRRYQRQLNSTLATSPHSLDNTYVSLNGIRQWRNDTTYVSLSDV
jgi:hypothetical protein